MNCPKMSHILITTKLHVPQIRTIRVKRTHLLNRLQQSLDMKLILISAPAGYGKTTLVSDWLITNNISFSWVSLEKADNNAARFWSYIICGLHNSYPEIENTFPNNLLTSNISRPETYLTDLINELDKLNSPLILVLDDYQNIQSQEIHGGIAFLLEHSPLCFHLVISSRSDPPLPLAKLRGISQMVEIRLADLRFSILEITEFMHKVMDLDLSKDDLSLLEVTTEGWIAGLQMAGLSLKGKNNPSELIRTFSGEDRYILDFLFEEVFNQQSDKIKKFLLQTSILERLCAPLCNAVTRHDDGQANLTFLEQNNLFLFPLDDQRKWYRYHFLFRDLLRNRFKQTLIDEQKTLHQRACAWYDAEGDLEIAISHALAASDFDAMAVLLEKFAQTLDWQNQQSLFASWLEKIPVAVMRNYPWLCIYRAWGSYWTGHRSHIVEDWLGIAEKTVEKNHEYNQKHKILGHIAAIRAHMALVSKNISLAHIMAYKSLDLLPEGDPMRSEAAIALGGVYWALGDVIQSKEAFCLARDEAIKINYKSMAAGSSVFISLQQVKQGLLNDAIATLESGIKMATLPDGSEMSMAGFINCRLGDIWRQKNRLETASNFLSKGIVQSRRLGQPDLLTDAYICLARYKFAIGDTNSVNDVLDTAEQIAREVRIDPWILCWLDECRIKAWIKEGNLEAANLWMQNSGLSLDNSLEYQSDLHHQNLARVYVARHVALNSDADFTKASLLLNRLQYAAKFSGWIHEEIKILVLKAINYQAKGYRGDAIACLVLAISLALPGGFFRVFLDEGEILGDLFSTVNDISEKVLEKIFRDTNLDIQAKNLSDYKEHLSRINTAFRESSSEYLTNQKIHTQPQHLKYGSPKQSTEKLTAREMDVLYLLAKGFPDKKIADTLVITYETVHKHLKNIYGKLDVHSRTEAVIRAQTLGLI